MARRAILVAEQDALSWLQIGVNAVANAAREPLGVAQRVVAIEAVVVTEVVHEPAVARVIQARFEVPIPLAERARGLLIGNHGDLPFYFPTAAVFAERVGDERP